MKLMFVKEYTQHATFLVAALCLSLMSTSASVSAEPLSAQRQHEAPTKRAPADLLLDAIDVWVTPELVARAGLTAEHAERVLLNRSERRYRRIRAMAALCITSPERALEVLPELMRSAPDAELRVQAVIHLTRAFGEERRAQVEGLLREALNTHKDAKVRAMITRELERSAR